MIGRPVEPAVTEYLHAKAARMHLPLNGTFELTPLCNMSCRMCYVRMTRQKQESLHPLYSSEEWLRLAREARDRGMIYLLLTGGEPFLREDLREILAGLHKMGFIISINSNATLINEQVIEWLKQTPPVRINVTLYGASNETYEQLCNNPEGFTQVTNAIHLLKEAGISVKLNCSITPYNAKDLDEIFAFARKEELLIQATSYMFPPVRRDASMTGRNDRFTAQEAAYYSARIEALLNGKEAFLKHMENEEMKGLGNENGEDCPVIESECEGQEMEGECVRCRAGKCSFWVTWDGRFLPCGMLSDQNTINVFEQGFDVAWENAMKIAEEIRLPVECKRCDLKKICKACAAMVVTESGDYRKVPEYRCQMAHEYFNACKKVESEIRNEAI